MGGGGIGQFFGGEFSWGQFSGRHFSRGQFSGGIFPETVKATEAECSHSKLILLKGVGNPGTFIL